MGFDIQNIPSVIEGTAPQPGAYGFSTHQQYRGYLNAAETTYAETGDSGPLNALSQASIRYTPAGTISTGNITEEALQNALGYAAADIEALDQNGDRALDRREVLDCFLSPFLPQLEQLRQAYHACPSPQEQATIAYHHNMIVRGAFDKMTNTMGSVDVNCDGRLTADESAAKLLFDDNSKQLFEDNTNFYRQATDCFPRTVNQPSYAELQTYIRDVIHANPNTPYQLDGLLTPGDLGIGDALTEVPTATGAIVGGIHDALELEDILAETNPFTPRPGDPNFDIYR